MRKGGAVSHDAGGLARLRGQRRALQRRMPPWAGSKVAGAAQASGRLAAQSRFLPCVAGIPGASPMLVFGQAGDGAGIYFDPIFLRVKLAVAMPYASSRRASRAASLTGAALLRHAPGSVAGQPLWAARCNRAFSASVATVSSCHLGIRDLGRRQDAISRDVKVGGIIDQYFAFGPCVRTPGNPVAREDQVRRLPGLVEFHSAEKPIRIQPFAGARIAGWLHAAVTQHHDGVGSRNGGKRTARLSRFGRAHDFIAYERRARQPQYDESSPAKRLAAKHQACRDQQQGNPCRQKEKRENLVKVDHSGAAPS